MTDQPVTLTASRALGDHDRHLNYVDVTTPDRRIGSVHDTPDGHVAVCATCLTPVTGQSDPERAVRMLLQHHQTSHGGAA